MTWPAGDVGTRLTPSQFAMAVKRGLGRAVLHARGGLSADELTGLRRWYLESPAFDSQIEDDRASHVLQISEAAKDHATLRQAVWSRLQHSAALGGHDAGYYVIHLAEALAERGDAPMKESLYELLKCGAPTGNLLSALPVIRLEGIQGLVRVASITGDRFSAEDRWQIPWWVETIADPKEDTQRFEEVLAALRSAAQDDHDVAAFLRLYQEPPLPQEPDPRDLIGPSFDDLIRFRHDTSELRPGRFTSAATRWARRADRVELRRAAAELETTSDKELFYALARIWGEHRPFPLPPATLIRRAMDESDPMRDRAQAVLDHLDDPAIHEAGVALIEQGRIRRNTLKMLFSHCEEDDAALLERHVLRREWEDEDLLHGVAMDVKRLCDGHDSPAWNPHARWVYEMTPCSFCRHDAFGFLARQRALSPELAAEALLDSDKYTREIAQAFHDGREIKARE